MKLLLIWWWLFRWTMMEEEYTVVAWGTRQTAAVAAAALWQECYCYCYCQSGAEAIRRGRRRESWQSSRPAPPRSAPPSKWSIRWLDWEDERKRRTSARGVSTRRRTPVPCSPAGKLSRAARRRSRPCFRKRRKWRNPRTRCDPDWTTRVVGAFQRRAKGHCHRCRRRWYCMQEESKEWPVCRFQ